jgi:hypothetical protein
LSATADLVGSTDPVQYSIRLLLPKGSLLLAEPDPVLLDAMAAAEAGTSFGSVAWRHRDRRLEELQAELAHLAEGAPGSPAGFARTFEEIWSLARAAGAPLEPEPPAPREDLAYRLPAAERPHLSEAWFCCAEPTGAQLELVRR